jgi:tetratricopeptide (TPR) repeat protein
MRARVAAWRARISNRLGRHEDTIEFAEAAINLALDSRELMALAEALEYSDVSAQELGRPAGRQARRALAIYEELGALRDEARVRNALGVLAYHRGEWSEALEQYEASESAFARSGARWIAATPAANSAEILADQGRLQEARASFERAIQVWRSVNAASDVAFGDYQLGRIAARQGRDEEALGRLRAAREHFQAVGELAEVVVVDAFTAEARCCAGEYAEALELADDALDRARMLGGVAAITPLLQRVRGVALLALGRSREGARALRSGLESARARGAGHEIAFALQTLIDADLARAEAEQRAWQEELTILAGGLGLQLS